MAKRILGILLLTGFTLCSWAQAPEGPVMATIIFADGEDFEILDVAERNVEIDTFDPIGQVIVEGDTLLTYENTFVELETTGGNLVKIAENTVFSFEEKGTQNGGTFNMLYGRMRAKVGKLSGNEKFIIKSESAIAGVRGTDFGMSVLFIREGVEVKPTEEKGRDDLDMAAAVTQVYCFDGEVEVSIAEAREEKPGDEPSTLILRTNEMVEVGHEALLSDITQREVTSRIQEYWRIHDFKGRPGVSRAEGVPQQPEAAAESEPGVDADALSYMVLRRNAFSITGFVALGMGLVSGVVGVWDIVDDSVDIMGDNGVSFMISGGILATGGVLALISSARVNRAIRELRER